MNINDKSNKNLKKAEKNGANQLYKMTNPHENILSYQNIFRVENKKKIKSVFKPFQMKVIESRFQSEIRYQGFPFQIQEDNDQEVDDSFKNGILLKHL